MVRGRDVLNANLDRLRAQDNENVTNTSRDKERT